MLSQLEGENLLNEFLDEIPTLDKVIFTTPSLDFKDHANNIDMMIEKAYGISQRIQNQDNQEVLVSNIPILTVIVFECLVRFNFLTRPPSRKNSKTTLTKNQTTI
jgi:hypothetical protein